MKTMKYITAIMLMALTLITVQTTQATSAERIHDNGKYALLVRTMQHINASLKTAGQMRESGMIYDAFEIVICGKVIKELVGSGQMGELLAKAKSLGVQLSVCGMSMEKLKIPEDALADGFEVVPNGLIRIFALQQDGYQTIEL